MYLLYHETVLDGKASGSFDGSLVLLMVLLRKEGGGLFVEMWSEG